MNKISIKNRITIILTLSVIIFATITFLIFKFTIGIILDNNNKTILLSSLNISENKIKYLDSVEPNNVSDDYYITPYNNGFLKIDYSFLNNNNNVNIAIFSKDGELIYGECLLSNSSEFTSNTLYQSIYDGVSYQIFEKELKTEGTDALWLKAAMPLTTHTQQIHLLTNIFILLLIVFIVASILISNCISKIVLKPINTINNYVAGISDTCDLKRKLNMNDSDELSILCNNINRMNSRLNESFEKERQFMIHITNNFRNPLSVISSQCEYMLEKRRNINEYSEALKTILRQSGKMNSLINKVSEYSCLDSKKNIYPTSIIDLSSLVRDIGNKTVINNIDLVLEVSDDICIIGNRLLQTRLLQDLLHNAYMHSNVKNSIILRLSSKDHKAILEIDGIDKENANNTKLSMINKIVDIHNAHISINNNTGNGSCYRIIYNQV